MKNNFNTEPKSGGRAWLPFLVILVIAGAIILWLILGRNNNKPATVPSTKNTPHQVNPQSTNTQLDSLITYKLPQGWTDADCVGKSETILIIANGQHPFCSSDAQNWPIKLTLDTQNTTDCHQITVDNSKVTKHICSSLFINGAKTIKSSTTYNDKSPYGHATKVSDYYIKTGKGVVKLEYVDNQTVNTDDYQAGFDQLAASVKTK
jgi:hypothetical protein